MIKSSYEYSLRQFDIKTIGINPKPLLIEDELP